MLALEQDSDPSLASTLLIRERPNDVVSRITALDTMGFFGSVWEEIVAQG